jgi:hypothetical protein
MQIIEKENADEKCASYGNIHFFFDKIMIFILTCPVRTVELQRRLRMLWSK